MPRDLSRAMSCIGTALALGFASLASAANAVRISQVYGGGSGTSAPYNADFVELYNSGASSVSIAGWTITYTSTTGDFGGNQFTFPAGASIPASSYLCVQMQATGTVGAAVPFDFIAATAINLSATGGNVALLTAAQTGSNNTCASLAATLVDKVAFGGGNCPEGTAASAPATTTAIIRKGNGATDTDANSSDFFVATPYPRNLSFTQSVIATTGSTLEADGWTLASSGTVSSGIASSDGNGGTNGLAGNQAWRLGAATGASITATRAITTAAGMVVALDFDNGTVASSTSTGIEFLSGTTSALKFQLTGGSANYSIVDSAGTVATTLAATTSGVRVSVLLSASGAYTLTAGAYTRSGTLAGSATTFSSIRVFDTAVGTTAATLVYFNHLRVGFNSLTSTVTAGSIPDNSTVGRVVSFPMTATQIPAGTAVRDVRVTLTGLAHQNAGDVSAVVIAPDGTSSPLFIRPGATNSGGTGADVANFTTDYSFADSAINNLWTATSGTSTSNAAAGWYFPSVLFTGARSALSSSFAGKDPVGTWQVKVTDLATGTTGTLTSATLELRIGADSDGDDAADIFDGCPSNGALLAPATYYIDADNDGYGSTTTTTSCASTPPAGTSANSTDCNDASAAINPGATELCDGIDQNCNGIADDGFADADGDGVGNCVDTNLTYTIAGAAIPDATSATPNVPGVLNKTFVVTSGQIPGAISDVRVTFVGLTHTYMGDVTASLIAPNGTTALIIGRVGATAAVPYGDASNYGGNYAFFDAATASIWTAAAAAGTTAITPAGSYYPSTTLTGARVALTNAFTGVVAAGTWTVRLTDSTNVDVGSVTTIIVDLTPSAAVDTDGDGTPDAQDGCPTDPNKIAVGACGCGVAETDSDGDGTPNCIDGCPSDPNKIAPGACGCGVPNTDSDGDGTPNCNDACPNDPNKIAAGTCGCGVADTDSDSDGTPNCNDACPNDPNKIAAGACGCGVADTDSDGDGTANCNDGCPNDPLKTSPGTCGCGVVDTTVDSDGDGTNDCTDLCPNDPLKIAPGTCGCGVVDSAVDSDGDGTPNCNDGCPNDPLKVAAGTCGCGVADTDSDSDGTPNCNDLCPNDPLKTAAGTCGCGVADTDSDSDGTPNCNDLCPNDPLKIAAGTCGCGVADTDSDSDGTPNCNDLCPNDPLKLAPGTCGCGVAETDSDADGTPNCTDGCPNDPLKIAAGACGCGVVETDSDGDGTPNCVDTCPNDPLKTSPGDCGCGVSDLDTDGDGDADCIDATTAFNLTGGSIPDNLPSGLVKTFTVPVGAFATGISAVKVTLTGLTHTWCGDLTAFLIAPDGTTVKAFERIGLTSTSANGEDSDFGGTYNFADSFTASVWTAASAASATAAIPSGDYYPSVITTGARGYLLAGLAGHPLTGTWTLKITDGANQDLGTLTSAIVEFTPAPAGDSDGDGTQNGFDGCPNDPNKITPGTCGCGVQDSSVDSDGDGTIDCVDTTFTRTVTGASITDNNATGLVRTFTIPAGEFPDGLTEITVSFAGITHANMGDLTATLESPTGTVVSLFTRIGATTTTGTGDSSNFSGGPYVFADSATTSLWTVAAAGGSTANIAAGNYYPSAALTGARVALTAAYASNALSGTWTLRVKDTVATNTGSYTTATIHFTPEVVLDSDGDGTPDASDGCPNDASKTSPGTCGCGVAETDSDADGTPNCIDACPNDPNKIAAGACGCGVVETDSDSDGTPNCIDACPNDANKIAAGACGCGSPDVDANTNGTIDCLEITPTVSITVVGGGSSFGAGDTFTVRVAHSNPGRNISQARLSIGYDASALLPLSVQPTAGSPFSEQVMLQISEANGTIRTITRAPNGSGAAANDSDITFVVLPGANVCSASGVVNSTTIAGNPTQLVSVDGGLLDPILSPLGLIRADGLAPVFSGIPNSVSIPTDAGSTAGAVISAPVTSASDNCDGARAVTISVLYPDATTGNAWPVNDLFPVGTSVVTFATGDSVGNNTSTSRTVEVGNYQYLDVAIALGGTVSGNSTRPIRISVGSTLTVVNVSMTGASGAISNFQVPATQTPPCVAVKDTNHSIATANIVSVVGTEYALSVELTQGDCNDDNRIDILDFGTFVASRGASVASNAISNFNADTIVNNSDLSFISVNFFHIGDTCGSYTGDPALERIKVKDLRRAGMGHLDIADLNHDGWLDSGDIAHYMQFGAPPNRQAPHTGAEDFIQTQE